MDKLDRGKILFRNYKKAVNNLNNRIEIYKNLQDDTYEEIVKESIIQTNEICVELAWKVAKNLSLSIEPTLNIAGSVTAVKQAFTMGVIEDEAIVRSLLHAVQNRNISSHEYLINEGLDIYIDDIVNKYYTAYVRLIPSFEKVCGD